MNWQRNVSVEDRDGRKLVVKRDKNTKIFHEYVLSGTFASISLLLAHPSTPPSPEMVTENEGLEMRKMLDGLGIPTPKLISLKDGELIEEYIEGGDLYRAVTEGKIDAFHFAFAGKMTGKMHNAGYAFIDNKAQNYLVRENRLYRTDLGFIKKDTSVFSRSMDIGSFLASIMDISEYRDLEKAFYEGYVSETKSGFAYLSLVIRNILSVGFSSDSRTVLRNMLLDSSSLIRI